MNGGGTLDAATNDSIQQTDTSYLYEKGIWYRVTTQSTCHSGKLSPIAITKDRLTLPPTMLSQTIQIDETGKATTITTTVDRAQSLVTETVYPANPSQPSTRIIRNGVLQSEQFRPLHLEEPAIPGDSPAADKRISPTPPAFVSKPNPLAGPGAHENPYPMPFIGAQPSLTPEENNIFAQACIELQKDGSSGFLVARG